MKMASMRQKKLSPTILNEIKQLTQKHAMILLPDLKTYLLMIWYRGLILWLFVWPTGVYLLDFFCSAIQFYLLLSPYLCFVSFLYLDLYV